MWAILLFAVAGAAAWAISMDRTGQSSGSIPPEDKQYFENVEVAMRNGNATANMVRNAITVAKRWYPDKVPAIQQYLNIMEKGVTSSKPPSTTDW